MKAKRYVVVGYDDYYPRGAEEDFLSAHDTLEDARVAFGALQAKRQRIGTRFNNEYVLDLQPDDSPEGMPLVVWTAKDEAAS